MGKFLVICAPIIKFLLNKYLPMLSPQIQSSDVIKRFVNFEILTPEHTKSLIIILTDLRNYLINNNVMYRVNPLKKLIGDNKKWSGLLNLLINQKHDVYLFCYEPNNLNNLYNYFQDFLKNYKDEIRIIAPLSLDQTEELYSFIQNKLEMPVSPFLLNFETSKFLLQLLFGSYGPRMFYFPEGFYAFNYLEKIQKISNQENIEYFLVKDEFDFDFSPVVTYPITPFSKLETYCRNYYDNIKGIPNIGGILIQEFLVSNLEINVIRSFIYNQIIPKANLYYKYKIKPYKDGIILNENIESYQLLNIDIPDQIYQIFNPIISQFYPFLFSCIDYIMFNNSPKVIDVNSITNCFTRDSEIELLDIDNIFNFYISSILNENRKDTYEKQIGFQNKISNFYNYVKKLGPCFISGDRLILLENESILSIKEILNITF